MTAETPTLGADMMPVDVRGDIYRRKLIPVPMWVFAPWDDQAQKNHRQSLEELRQRGGLDVQEAVAILTGMEKCWLQRHEAHEVLVRLVHAATSYRGQLEKALAQLHEAHLRLALLDDQQRSQIPRRSIVDVLTRHYLTDLHSELRDETHQAVCACGTWAAPITRSLNEAILAWADHVAKAV
jgi:hypothetical protein